MVGWNNNQAVYIAPSDSSKPSDLLGVGTKFKESIFKNNNETTRTRFVDKMNQYLIKDWHPNEKMMAVPVDLNYRCCSSEWVGVVSY